MPETPAAASRDTSNRVPGRSPGSQVLMRRLPGTIAAGFQWHDGAPALAYRCGGSTGIAGSTPTHLFPVSPRYQSDIAGTTNWVILASWVMPRRDRQQVQYDFRFHSLLLDRKEFFNDTSAVEIDISSLEAKVERVAEFCEQLRAENHALRERVAHLEQENSELTQRMKSARERVETLMEKLPSE